MKVLVVSVSDIGQGIEESQKSRMFKKFSQLEESKQRPGNSSVGQPSGTGLGLNLCLKFLHRMKGNIWATNNNKGVGIGIGKNGSLSLGSCFSFYLPIHEADDDDATVASQQEESSSQERKKMTATTAVFSDCKGLLASFCDDPSQLRVLVVDDTLINLKVLDRMLKRVGVGKIQLAGSGEKALEILAEEDYDLVISDIQMPAGISGTEFSAAIRDGDLAKKPVVVGLTAEVSQSLDRRCAASGMACVLHKPITTEQLQDFFNKMLTSDGPVAQAQPEVETTKPTRDPPI